jgi:F-type H+-transporting ATPase subunit delta
VITTPVAIRYAKALFELLDPAGIEPVRKGLEGLTQLYISSPQLKHVLASPAFRSEDKVAVLTELSRRLGFPTQGQGFLAQLVRKNRTGSLAEIAEAFVQLADQAKGARQVSVTSPRALTAAEQETLRSRLRELLQRDIDLTVYTEPGLLAGLRIQIGSTVIDSSVRSRLATMRAALSKE